jgi:hypothetical protein
MQQNLIFVKFFEKEPDTSEAEMALLCRCRKIAPPIALQKWIFPQNCFAERQLVKVISLILYSGRKI